jgi:hypothetical protein
MRTYSKCHAQCYLLIGLRNERLIRIQAHREPWQAAATVAMVAVAAVVATLRRSSGVAYYVVLYRPESESTVCRS